jgi:hypothetical protein
MGSSKEYLIGSANVNYFKLWIEPAACPGLLPCSFIYWINFNERDLPVPS